MRLSPARHAADARWCPEREVWESYRATLERCGLSAGTRRVYASRLGEFLGWLARTRTEDGAHAGVDAALALRDGAERERAVRRFREHLVDEHGCGAATINNYLAALDHFYRTHQGLGATGASRERPAGPATAPDSTELRRFQAVVARLPSPRDRAICALARYGGLRVAELAAAGVDDVVYDEDGMRVVARGPDGTVRRTGPVLPEAARAAVEHWLRRGPSAPSPDGRSRDRRPLFPGRGGRGLSERRIRQILAEVAAAATVPVTAHRLRLALTAQLCRSGHPAAQVQRWLGGRSPEPGASPVRRPVPADRPLPEIAEARAQRIAEARARLERTRAEAARLAATGERLLARATHQIRSGHLTVARAHKAAAAAYEYLADTDPARYGGKVRSSQEAATAARERSRACRTRPAGPASPPAESPAPPASTGRRRRTHERT
ncbi:tyrosine-type recombinase/integrase [Actinomadura namibiensis]|uniref:Integrase n=1 Tax=Actinomadura namibiensis TaxID=182080 RepID=A0A7W3QP40_ACTNM|nr:site-specific integrase [Actinomadura namibiensis]MBA8954280.1 integrase [Actinomadura namibiensis]